MHNGQDKPVKYSVRWQGKKILSEFYIAIEYFRDAVKLCVQQLADLKEINYIQMHRMSDLGWDIVGFAESMARAHINATMWMMDAAHEAEVNHQAIIEPPEDMLTLIQTSHQPSEEAREYWKKRMESGTKVMERMSRHQRSRAATMEEDATRELKAAYKLDFIHFCVCGGILQGGNASPKGAVI